MSDLFILLPFRAHPQESMDFVLHHRVLCLRSNLTMSHGIELRKAWPPKLLHMTRCTPSAWLCYFLVIGSCSLVGCGGFDWCSFVNVVCLQCSGVLQRPTCFVLRPLTPTTWDCRSYQWSFWLYQVCTDLSFDKFLHIWLLLLFSYARFLKVNRKTWAW